MSKSLNNFQRLCRCVRDFNCLTYSKNKILNMKISHCREALQDLLLYVVLFSEENISH